MDINKHSKKPDELREDYTSNSEILHELMEVLNDALNFESVDSTSPLCSLDIMIS